MLTRRTLVIVGFALFTFLLYICLPYNSAFVEKYYSLGLFKFYRLGWDHSLSYSPIPLIYLLVLFLSAYVARKLVQYFGSTKSRRDRWTFILNGALAFLAWTVVLFYWLWGFNYKRLDSLQFLQVEVVKPSEDQLFEELELLTKEMIDVRPYLSNELGELKFGQKQETVLRKTLVEVINKSGYNVRGRVRARLIYPRGTLLHFSTAGIYLPFVGEGHVDPGLHGLTWPFTVSHEMAHGYGFTGEDMCNFWALMACVNSPDPLIRYSGFFSYWRYLLSNARLANRKRYDQYLASVPDRIKTDLKEVYEYSERYVDILPGIRDMIYDGYLKSHGIHEGLQNYSRIIVLVHSWKEEKGSLVLP